MRNTHNYSDSYYKPEKIIHHGETPLQTHTKVREMMQVVAEDAIFKTKKANRKFENSNDVGRFAINTTDMDDWEREAPKNIYIYAQKEVFEAH